MRDFNFKCHKSPPDSISTEAAALEVPEVITLVALELTDDEVIFDDCPDDLD